MNSNSSLTQYIASFTFYPLHLIPYTLHLTPYTLYLIPYTLHLTPYTLHLTPYTLYLIPYTLHLTHHASLFHKSAGYTSPSINSFRLFATKGASSLYVTPNQEELVGMISTLPPSRIK